MESWLEHWKMELCEPYHLHIVIKYYLPLKRSHSEVQWATLNGIMDNVINWLLGSNLSQMKNPKLLFNIYCKFEFIHLL